MLVTFVVLNDVKSRLARPEQYLNIEPISVTFAVFSIEKLMFLSLALS